MDIRLIEAQRMLDDAAFFLGVARNLRIEGFQQEARETRRIVANLRRSAIIERNV
jgi:hypothetical protein